MTATELDRPPALRPRPMPGTPAATDRGSRRGLVAVLIVGSVLLAAVIVLATGFVIKSADADEQNRLEAARSSALAAGRTYATDLTTYNYRTIDKDLTRAESDLTGKVKTQFTATAAVLKPAVSKYRSVSTPTMQAVAVQSIHENDAVVIALVDQTVHVSTSTAPQFDRNRMQLTMHRAAGGRWLVTKIELI